MAVTAFPITLGEVVIIVLLIFTLVMVVKK